MSGCNRVAAVDISSGVETREAASSDIEELSDRRSSADPLPDSVGALGEHLKALFVNQQWTALAECLREAPIWCVDAPLSVAAAMDLAARVLEGAEDVELTLLRILKSEQNGQHPSGSYLCRLGWYDPKRVKQEEVNFDLHLGFDVSSGVRVRYIGVTAASPEPTLAEPAGPAATAAPATAAPVETPLQPGAFAVASGAETVMVYAPLLVPASALRTLLGGAVRER